MSVRQNATDTAAPQRDLWRALVQCVVLLGLVVWLFWPEIRQSVPHMTRHLYWAHAPVMPVAMLALGYLRRRRLVEELGNGSLWGLLLMLAGLALLSGTIWPFGFGYIRAVAIVPVSAGMVLAVCGWRVLWRCLPMLFLLLLAVPIGTRKYADMMILPERHTLAATRAVLDQLPGVTVTLLGRDLSFVHDDRSGTIALGEPRRGASLLPAYAAIGVFVAFARIRPLWQIVVLAVAAIPVVLFCNLARLLVWGLVTIYGGAGATSGLPRVVAVAISLLLAYAAFAALAPTLAHLVIEDAEESGDQEGLRPEA